MTPELFEEIAKDTWFWYFSKIYGKRKSYSVDDKQSLFKSAFKNSVLKNTSVSQYKSFYRFFVFECKESNDNFNDFIILPHHYVNEYILKLQKAFNEGKKEMEYLASKSCKTNIDEQNKVNPFSNSFFDSITSINF